MKRIIFERQNHWGSRQWPQMDVNSSHIIQQGVYFGEDGDRSTGTGFIHLDLDQVEELHRRLGEHLKEHGRPALAPVKKWRDG